MTAVEGAHNIAKLKYSMCPVVQIAVRSKDRRVSIHSKLINLLEMEQIYYCCVNKMDCDTAGSKQECDEISNEMKNLLIKICRKKDFTEENTHNQTEIWRFVEMTENDDD